MSTFKGMKMRFFLFVIALSGAIFSEHTANNYDYLIKEMPKINPKLLEIHFKLYEGYVKQVNFIQSKLDKEKDAFILQSLRKQYGFEYDGMRLHELYFDQLGSNGKTSKTKRIVRQIEEKYGSMDAFVEQVESFSKTRGIGWVILFGNITNSDIDLVWVGDHEKGFLAGWVPILVIDLWEHAYISQFNLDKQAYVETIFSYLNWSKINTRYISQCKTRRNEFKVYKKKTKQ